MSVDTLNVTMVTEISRSSGVYRVTLRAVPMGRDWTVVITGGDIPHLGAVALAVARPSLKDPSRGSATVSVLALCGHKEDELARSAAEAIASALKVNATVTCGIHTDDLSVDDIGVFVRLVQETVSEFVNRFCTI